MKTTVINIYGAPGAGKSTLAAEIYAELSKKGESVELVREVAKEYAWTGKIPSVFEQIYLTNEQMLKETSLYGKVKYLITDSPIPLGDFYCKHYHNNNALEDLGEIITKEALKRQLINPPIGLLVMIDPIMYKDEGRYSDVTESQALEIKMIDYFDPFLRKLKILNTEDRIKEAMKVIYAG